MMTNMMTWYRMKRKAELMKHLLCCALVCGVLLGSSGFDVAEAKEEYIVSMGTYNAVTPFTIGDVKGFFAEEGISLKLKYYLRIQEWFNAIIHHRADIGAGLWNTTHMETLLSGAHFIFLGAIGYEAANYQFVVTPEFSPHDLATQKIGLNLDLLGYRWIIWEYAKSHNMDIADFDVAIINNENLLKNFLVGRLKAVLLPEQFAQRAVEEGGGVMVAASTPLQSLTGMVMSQEAYAAMPREDLKKLYRGLIRAIRWIHDPANTEELYTILHEQFPEPGISDFSNREAFEKSRALVPVMQIQELYDYNSGLLEDAYRTMKQLVDEMGKPSDFSYSEIVDTGALLEVLDEMGLHTSE